MPEHISDDALFNDPEHLEFLGRQRKGLVDFVEPHVCSPDGGYTWIGDDGLPITSKGKQLWIGARMIHVFSLATMLGRPHADDVVNHGLDFYVDGDGYDASYGGWYTIVGGDTPSQEKELYGTAHMLLAGSSSTLAGFDRGRILLDRALDLLDTRYWDASIGRARESYDRTFTHLDDYRGQNANMHLTEAFLAAYEATGDEKLLQRAVSIARFIAGRAVLTEGEAPWRLPEHFDSSWTPLWDYNLDDKRHAFRPYGTQVGHWLEWAKLCIQMHDLGADEPWLIPTAELLFRKGIEEGWAPTGGFYYTLDWDGQPIVSDKFFWSTAEAAGAAKLLWDATEDPYYARWYRTIWNFAREHFVSPDLGTWQHELDDDNRPTSITWQGRPDAYHVYQATLYPLLPRGKGVARWAADTTEPYVS